MNTHTHDVLREIAQRDNCEGQTGIFSNFVVSSEFKHLVTLANFFHDTMKSYYVHVHVRIGMSTAMKPG